MAIDAKSKEVYEFKKQLKALEGFRGRGTELISVYITPGYQISDITNKLKEEAGQATNIKSTGTRNNVTDALSKILAFLKNFKQPPANGMAVFCGNVSEIEGKQDIQLFSIEPPAPLHVQFYRCESVFVLEPLKELVEHEGAYGLVVMDGKEATVAVLRGKNIKVIKQIHSTAHSKTHKGGQCLHEKTLVQMANGEIKEIRDVKPRDMLLSFNWAKQAFEEAECTNVMTRTSNKALSIKTKSPTSEVIATAEHRFFVWGNKDVEEKLAEELKAGDLLLSGPVNTASTNTTKLIQVRVARIWNISSVETKGPFYDLEVPGNENFVANGMIVHNSAARFQRLREEGIEWFQERIGEAMAAFLEVKGFKGVIVGGPGPAKEDFLKAKTYNYQLKLLAMVDTGYTDEYGLRELLEKAGDVISEQESIVEKRLLADFMSQAAREGAVVYGYDAVKQAIESNQAKQLLVSENQNFFKLDLQCSACGFTSTVTSTNNIHESDCTNCKSGKLRSVKSTDLINEIIGMAEDRQMPVEMISTETSEGEQFAGGFHGIGAFLRYK